MLINFLGVLYIIFVMKEPKPRIKEDVDKERVVMLLETKSSGHASTAVEPVTNNTTVGNLCRNVVKDSIMVIIRKRSGNSRKIVYLVLVIVGLSQAIDYGMTVNAKCIL